MPYTLNPNIVGITAANSNFTGTTITVKWAQAYPMTPSNKIGYNIYFNSDQEPDFTVDHFSRLPDFYSIGPATSATIEDLTPGISYHFGVRAFEYDPTAFDFSTFPLVYETLRVLPRSYLSASISSTSLLVPLIDTDGFPSSGRVRIDEELISYSSINISDQLVVASRAVGSGIAKEHIVDGYDGYNGITALAVFWPVMDEEQNTRVYECQARFDLKHQNYLPTDGYHQRTTDLLNTDMTVSDVINADIPPYQFGGYHTDPRLVLSGQCIGSYIGGVQGCADGYNGSFIVRGVSAITQNQQRQEILLGVDGEPVILLKRQWTGITCSCYIPQQEYPEARCGKCYGSGFIVGWQQFFNPKRSDGKIMVRFDPAVETVDPTESGLESNLKPTNWTLTYPSIHSRDVIVRFDQAGNEEFRYEVINVTRNKFILDSQGLQRFSLQRIRKTDIIYMIPVYEDVATNSDGSTGVNFLRLLNMSLEMSPGFPYHTHTIEVGDRTISPVQVNGITSIVQGHSHRVLNGVVNDGSEVPGEEGIGHHHSLIWSPP